MGLRGPYICLCCGAPESTSGCVRGMRCRCDQTEKCDLCAHCVDHHHKNCTEAVRFEMMTAIAAVRDKHKINIFEPGEPKRELTGWYRTSPSGEVIDY